MATRRPKVPKVAPNRPAKDTSDAGHAQGADVIRAHFGSGKDGAGHAPGSAAGSSPSGRNSGSPAATRSGSGSGPAPAKTPAAGTARSGAAAGKASPKGGTPSSEADQQPVPAKAFSGRMLALAVVMVAITIMLAPTVKVFFDKKAEIDALNADIAARQAAGDALRQQVSRWQDPNYVKQQARDRINMVMPGETGYWVFGSDLPADETGGQPGAAAAQDPADLPWVDSLWESITRAATE
ncbi:Septum formation initiator [Pseudarthrobacter chlorophenolicus A6]|uniref:Septum formation initiator n=1 Tax=Pseudarthrobacter chlorophenolicus (strain ATCC 700700 / DSM 12829 / CIP 107037 / JCM 12360 / KCTC 9906 / NCIMB 13794 / A6) TaxID=452863 RepID=B8HEU6_PSECP|nr:septum formation initiator family protein [Pseudarthrobacter chlorophenolicus]ACL39212.1 Septum formation initiator [Pseudarthrobacter chlorophenolicus A6]SDR02734.1 Cell division protein FtsB [Pseudarthrobacter chlorophenolicus]